MAFELWPHQHDTLREAVTNLLRFCPICGQELEAVVATTTITNSGAMDGAYHERFKQCREGHGSFSVGIEANTSNPDILAEFELNKEFLTGKE